MSDHNQDEQRRREEEQRVRQEQNNRDKQAVADADTSAAQHQRENQEREEREARELQERLQEERDANAQGQRGEEEKRQNEAIEQRNQREQVERDRQEQQRQAADTSVMEHRERGMNEDPHPEAQRQLQDRTHQIMNPGEPPDLQILDIAGGYVLVVMSVDGDPDAPNLAGRVMVRTILAEDRDTLAPTIATTLVSDFGMTPEEANELATGECGAPTPEGDARRHARDRQAESEQDARNRDGAMLTDEQRMAADNQWQPAREA